MNTQIALTLMTLIVFLTVGGCSQQPKAANSSQAIQQAQTKSTIEEKAKYLVDQAQAFLKSKQYEDAMASAQYVLLQLDQNSKAAQDILAKAQKELTKQAQEGMQKVQDTTNQAMNNMKKRLEGAGQ